jgi:DNA repair protein RadC
LSERKAEAVMAALSLSKVVETEHALSAPLESAEAIYRANLDMLQFHQEVLRVVLLDCKYHCIMKRDTFKGTVSECLAHPREILRPAIIHSAFAFALVHNHPSGATSPSEADLNLTKRIAAAARILQINLLDHLIVGQATANGPGYFSFKEAGLL